MNNYCMPPIIKITTRLDVLVGILALSMLSYLVQRDMISVTYVLITFFVFAVWVLVGLLRIYAYTACVFQGYRVSLIGMILYCIFVGITAIVTIFLLILVIRMSNIAY